MVATNRSGTCPNAQALGEKTRATSAVRTLVTTWTRRAVVRTVGTSFLLGIAVTAVTGAVSAPRTSLEEEAFSVGGLSLGNNHALIASRVTANPTAEYAFTTPDVGIVAPPPAPVHPRRAVTNNPIPASIAGNAVLEEAAKYVGTPYVYGGTSPSGFDCTGFVAYVYSAFGVSLPRDSSDYWSIGSAVSAADAQPGDLIVSSGHVGIYAGDGMQIDSPRPGKTVQFRGIWQSSYIIVRVS